MAEWKSIAHDHTKYPSSSAVAWIIFIIGYSPCVFISVFTLFDAGRWWNKYRNSTSLRRLGPHAAIIRSIEEPMRVMKRSYHTMHAGSLTEMALAVVCDTHLCEARFAWRYIKIARTHKETQCNDITRQRNLMKLLLKREFITAEKMIPSFLSDMRLHVKLKQFVIIRFHSDGLYNDSAAVYISETKFQRLCSITHRMSQLFLTVVCLTVQAGILHQPNSWSSSLK